MARFGLALYLVMATAVGPWLCCCTTVGMPASPSASQQPAPGEPEETSTSCCCCPKAPADEPPAEPVNSCPCHKSQADPVILPPTPVAEHARLLTVADALPGNPLDGSPALFTLDPYGRALWEGVVCPFQKPRDLLYALHLLLC